MEKKKELQISVRFSEIKVLGFQVTDYGNNLKDPIPSDKFEFTFEINSKINIDEKALDTILNVRLFDKSNPSNQELASMKAQFVLSLLNFDNLATIENGIVTIPESVVKLGISSAVATTRGLFVVYSSVHKFSNAIIPLINVNDFKIQNLTQPIGA